MFNRQNVRSELFRHEHLFLVSLILGSYTKKLSHHSKNMMLL